MNIPNVKITVWFSCTEDARDFCKTNAIGGWKFQMNGQRVYIDAPAEIPQEDWEEFWRMIGVKS